MTVRGQILTLLATRPDGIDDDEIARILDLSARQRANQVCRRLEGVGIVERRTVDGKIRNFLRSPGSADVPPVTPLSTSRTRRTPTGHGTGRATCRRP